MKKAALLVFAALLVVMFSVPAMAMEHQFGGLWRTRFYTQQNFDGNDIEPDTNDWTAVDTRTRLSYTAIFHENLRFVTAFEFDASWGEQGGRRWNQNNSNDPDDWTVNQELGWSARNNTISADAVGYGGGSWADIGSDGANVEIKQSFIDFSVGPIASTVGIQYFEFARGFLAAEDAPGLMVGYNGDGISIPFVWIKAYEGGISDNALDADYYGIRPRFSFNNFEIEPFVLYGYSDNGREHWNIGAPTGVFADEVGVWFAGFNADIDFSPVSLFMTGFYEGGSIDYTDNTSRDISAWLGAIGGSVNFGMGDVHGQFFYATGDDPQDNDPDIEAVTYLDGALSSYYWSEIMGLGMFDTGGRAAYGDDISNIMAANFGATVSPMDKLSITFDAWWAKLAEEIDFDDDLTNGFQGEDELGVELDLVITYELVEGLNMDIVGAYLFAGDAIYNGPNDADPYEIGTRLQLTF